MPFIRLLIVAAVTLLSSQPALADSGVRAMLVPSQTLDAAGFARTETLLKGRVAKIGFKATVSKGDGQIVVHAPNDITLQAAGIALTQRGVPALWWARPYARDIQKDPHSGTIAVWNDDWTVPTGRYLSLAFPSSPSVASPGITQIDSSPQAKEDTIPALTVHFDARTTSALAATRHRGDRLVLTIDDDMVAVAPADAAADRITIAAHEVGFNQKPLTAILRSAPLPARMVIVAAPYLGDSPASGLIFGNPPELATVLLNTAQPSTAAQTATALNRALLRMAIWGASATPRPDGTIAVRFDNKQDVDGLTALLGATSPMEWHWGQFVPVDSVAQLGMPPSNYGPSMNLGPVPVHLRYETAPALGPQDVVDAEIIRPAYDDSSFDVTLALTLVPSAANRLRDQMLTHGGQVLLASKGAEAMPSLGGLQPMLTAGGKLLLTGMLSRNELWPADAPVLRKTLPIRLEIQARSRPNGQ